MTATLTDRREELRWLARNWDERPHVVRELALTQMAHPSLLEPWALAEVWESYLGHLRLADGLDRQPWAAEVSWEDVNPDLTCADRTGAAVEEIWQRVAADEDVILNGTARKHGMGD